MRKVFYQRMISRVLLILPILVISCSHKFQPIVQGEPSPSIEELPTLAPIPAKDKVELLDSNADFDTVQQHVPTETLITWLQEALIKGVDPDFVRDELMRHDWIENSSDWHVTDFTGDGNAEWLVTIYLTDWRATWGRPGDFWIVGNRDLIYRFFNPEAYFCFYPCISEPNFFRDAAQIMAVTDLTGDNLPEVILATNTCGAHTCTQEYYIISHHHGVAQNLLSLPHDRFTWGDIVSAGYTEESTNIVMTYSKLLGVEDVTDDQIADALIYGGWHGSMGSGIQRTRTEIWSWDGEYVSLKEVRWDPTNYRMHILWEGNDNYYQGNYQEARTLFLRVINDDTLEEHPSMDQERQYASHRRFAAFRLILIALQENDKQEAIFWKHWLGKNYPDSYLASGARLLLEELDKHQDVELACSVVTHYLKQFETPLDIADRKNPTGSLYMDMGYANPALKAEDVCLIIIE